MSCDWSAGQLDSDWCSSFPDPSKNETNGLVIVSSPAQTRVDENSELLLECPDSQVMQILRVCSRAAND